MDSGTSKTGVGRSRYDWICGARFRGVLENALQPVRGVLEWPPANDRKGLGFDEMKLAGGLRWSKAERLAATTSTKANDAMTKGSGSSRSSQIRLEPHQVNLPVAR